MDQPSFGIRRGFVFAALLSFASAQADIGYFVCSGVCPDGKRVTSPSFFISESECSTIIASLLNTRCTDPITANNIYIYAYGFDAEGPATKFRDNLLIPTESSQAAQTIEAVEGGKCGCDDLVESIIREGIDINHDSSFCDLAVDAVAGRVTKLACKVRKVPVAGELFDYFCDTIIDKATSTLAKHIVEPICETMLKVVEDAFDLDLAKLYQEIATNADLAIEKVSSAVCGGLLCTKSSSACKATRPFLDSTKTMLSLATDLVCNECHSTQVTMDNVGITMLSVGLAAGVLGH